MLRSNTPSPPDLPLTDALAPATPDTEIPAAAPEQLHRLGEAAGYHVAVTWGAQPGTVDAIFIDRAGSADDPALTDLYLPPDRDASVRHPCQRSAEQHQDQRGASATGRMAARLHGPAAHRRARRDAADLLREVGPQGTSGTGVSGGRPLPCAGRRGRGDPGRHLCPGAGAAAGRGRRLVLRPGRRLAVGDAADRRRQRQPECRSVGPHRVRSPHRRPVGPPHRRGCATARATDRRRSDPKRSRCRSRRTDCGSSTSCKDHRRSTTWPSRCDCAGDSRPTRWAPH